MLAANALDEMHLVEEAISEYDLAVNLLESTELGDDDLADDQRLELKRDLATARVNRGIALNKIKRWKEAIADFDKAIDFREATATAGNHEFLESLASAHMHKGNALTECRDFDAAVLNYGRAILIFSDLVYHQQKHECIAGLANVYANRAMALRRGGDAEQALADLRSAASLYRKLLYDDGVIEVADALAETLMIAGNALSDVGRSEEALEEYDKTIEIREELVFGHGREDILRGLAMAKGNRGAALTKCGRVAEAVNEFDEAIEIYERPAFRHLEEELAVIRHAKAVNVALASKGDHMLPDVTQDVISVNLFELLGDKPIARNVAAMFVFTKPSVGGKIELVDLYFENTIVLRNVRIVDDKTVFIPATVKPLAIKTVGIADRKRHLESPPMRAEYGS
jgi:tetratricopeptide (TPR) repeat protein